MPYGPHLDLLSDNLVCDVLDPCCFAHNVHMHWDGILADIRGLYQSGLILVAEI